MYQGVDTEFQVEGLQSGLTYRLRVTAFNQVGFQSSYPESIPCLAWQ